MRAWQKALHRDEWQPWFAWHPVQVGGSLVWLQSIERCHCYAVIDEWWEYRLPLLEEVGREIGMPADMRFKPYLYARSSAASEEAVAHHELHGTEAGATRLSGEARWVEH